MKFVLLTALALLQGCNVSRAQDDSDQTLIGGRPADPKDWPASVYASMGGARCSATVVGPETLIIASHCVSHGGSASFQIGPNSYTSKCSRSPLYRQGTDHDLALCKITRKVEGIPYENVNINPELIKVGQEILLTGYGCIQPGGGGGNDGIYRIGEAKITALPDPYDLTAKGKAALCFGDSGGPAFIYLDEAKTKRVQISVNSKGDIRTTSYLTVTSSKASIDFMKSWATENNVGICGVTAGVAGCREGSKQPDPKPADECMTAYKTLGSCIIQKPIFFE